MVKGFVSGVLVLGSLSAWAYGPLLVTDSGSAQKWEGSAPTVEIVPEDGVCGSNSGAEMVTLLATLLQQFTDVAQSTLTVQVTDEPLINESGQQVNADINLTNYESVLGIGTPEDESLSSVLLDAAQNPMIWDDNCAIIADYLGPGNCGASSAVLGFSVPYVNTSTNAIVRSEEVINCLRNSDANTLQSTIIHEAGHGLGCDHSQANQAAVEDSDASNNSIVPLMYPTTIAVGDDPTTLQWDDELCVATLYPESTLTSNFWILEGSLISSSDLNGDGSLNDGIACANMVLQDISNPTENVLTFLTATAGSFTDSNGDGAFTASECTTNCGKFTFHGLSTSATYRLSVEPVDPDFTGGSSVGRCENQTNTDVPETTFTETFSSSSAATTVTATITCNDSDCSAPTISTSSGSSTTGGSTGGTTGSSSSTSGGCSLTITEYL